MHDYLLVFLVTLGESTTRPSLTTNSYFLQMLAFYFVDYLQRVANRDTEMG